MSAKAGETDSCIQPGCTRPATTSRGNCDEHWGSHPPMGDIPRRICVDRMTPAELAIRNAMAAVEDAGAHPLLTEAVMLLDQAKSKVADFVDGGAAA